MSPSLMSIHPTATQSGISRRARSRISSSLAVSGVIMPGPTPKRSKARARRRATRRAAISRESARNRSRSACKSCARCRPNDEGSAHSDRLNWADHDVEAGSLTRGARGGTVHTSIPCSMPAQTVSHQVPLSALARLLSEVDGLPEGATGALRFGERSVVLVENSSVCWATSPQMRRRLTDLLCQQVDAPEPRQRLEALYAECRSGGEPLGERLVSSGLVSARGLRTSLKQHNAEALALIALSGEEARSFVPHKHSRYDARFSFSTAELLVRMAEQRYAEEGRMAREVLRARLEPETTALVLKREPGAAVALPLALQNAQRLRLQDAAVLGQWTQDMLDVCGAVDGTTRVVSGTLFNDQTALAWQQQGLVFVALCDNRQRLARCLSRLHEQRLAGGLLGQPAGRC